MKGVQLVPVAQKPMIIKNQLLEPLVECALVADPVQNEVYIFCIGSRHILHLQRTKTLLIVFQDFPGMNLYVLLQAG